MTTTEYRESVLPRIITALGNKCICTNYGLRKLISFNFENYAISPLACADSEMLIHELLRSGQSCYSKEMIGDSWAFTCGKCGSKLHEHYDEYSISMNRSFIEYEGNSEMNGKVLIGYYGFDLSDVSKITDFVKITDANEYLGALNVA
jgi:hypothetical protein